MAFPLKDVRFTTRRSGDGVLLYPRLMRDRSILPKVDIAIQHLETMLGRERRELDPEVLVHFFGDHKLARCMVASLGRSYRFRARTISEVVTRTALRRLQRAGLDSPKALRLSLYDRLNADGDGFLDGEARDGVFGRLEATLSLRRGKGELERLLYLDADEHAVLDRVGGEPRPAHVVAQYNFGVLETVLRHAGRIELTLVAPTREGATGILRLAAANDVDVDLARAGSTLRVRLDGRQDALGNWARHGRRVARACVQLLERTRATVVDGTASVAFRDRQATLRLTSELLDVLGGAPARDVGWDEAEGWQLGAPLALDRPRPAPSGPEGAWRIKRVPDPTAWAAGVVIPELLLRRGRQAALVCLVRSAAHAERLATIAPSAQTGEPYLFVGPPSLLHSLAAAGATTVPAETFDLRAVIEALDTVDPGVELGGATSSRVA